MQRSPIEWTNFTSNPLKYRDSNGSIVHACIHKSTGCLHCYAETLAPRWGRAGKKFTAENMKHLTPFLDEKELHHMLTHKPASGKMCFVADMTDIFGEWVPFELIDRLFAVFALRPDVIWQVLTKRPERMFEYCKTLGKHNTVDRVSLAMQELSDSGAMYHLTETGWCFPNVWLGVSVETQQYADERIPLLLQTPAAKRFVSYEPALGPVDFTRIRLNAKGPVGVLPLFRNAFTGALSALTGDMSTPGRLDWIITGGESGPAARPFDVAWARSVVSQCKMARVAVFVKQLGTNPVRPWVEGEDTESLLCEGEDASKVRLGMVLSDRKGGSMEEWPEDIRVREFPK